MPPCRVCRSDHLEQFLDPGDTPHGTSLFARYQLGRRQPFYPLRLWFCRDCTTVQIDHTVPKEEMFGEYLYVSGTTETLRRHFRESAERLAERVRLGPGDLVVDIGSNDGTWLECYGPMQLRTVGVEPARNLAAAANVQGIDTLNRFFDAAAAREILATRGHPKLV